MSKGGLHHQPFGRAKKKATPFLYGKNFTYPPCCCVAPFALPVINDRSIKYSSLVQYIQKKDPSYQDEKESTAWSMDKFNDYVNEYVAPEKGLEENWVYRGLTVSRLFHFNPPWIPPPPPKYAEFPKDFPRFPQNFPQTLSNYPISKSYWDITIYQNGIIKTFNLIYWTVSAE